MAIKFSKSDIMPTPTEQLKNLLNSGTSAQNFKQLAMNFVRQGADVTVRSSYYGSEHTLLHILTLQNKQGVNNNEIIELIKLNPAVLTKNDGFSRNPFQSLLDSVVNHPSAFIDFKESAMLLARQGANIACKSKEGDEPTLLHILILQNENGVNNGEITEIIKRNPALLELKDYYNRTPLQSLLDAFLNKKCSFTHFKQTAMILAGQGADISRKSKEGDEPTLLHILVLQNENGVNNGEITEIIERNPAFLALTNYYNRTPLQSLLDAFLNKKCSFTHFKQTAMILARKGANIISQSKESNEPTLLHILVLHNKQGENDKEIVELVKLDAKVLTTVDYYRCTALQCLLNDFINNKCSFDHLKHTAMILARQGANITCQSKESDEPTLLHVLALHNEAGVNNNEMAELVTLDARVLNTGDYYHCTALQSIINELANKKCSLVNFKHSAMALARLGATLSQKGTVGTCNTLLHVLALTHREENAKEIEELIALNKEVLNYKDYYGQTPIHALLSQDPNLTVGSIEKLLSVTNLHLKNNQEGTLLHAAIRSGNLTAVKYLVDKKLSVTALTNTHKTLLHCAVISGNIALIQWLIDTKQININAIDKQGKTALFYAAHFKNREVCELLVRNGVNISPYQSTEALYQKIQTSPDSVSFAQGHSTEHTVLHEQRKPNLPTSEFHYTSPALNKLSENLKVANELFENIRIAREANELSKNQEELADQVTSNSQKTTEMFTATESSNIASSLFNPSQMTHDKSVFLSDQENSKDQVTLDSQKISNAAANWDTVPYQANPKEKLFQKIQALHDYGVLLKNKEVRKGQVAIDLANNLMVMANVFFEQKPEQRHFAEFQSRFTTLLHSQDQDMNAYRLAWGTLVANIAIALTGVGLLFIAGKLIHSQITENRALFFFQHNKTTSEEKIMDIEHASSFIAQSF